jgi:hypothetical protein
MNILKSSKYIDINDLTKTSEADLEAEVEFILSSLDDYQIEFTGKQLFNAEFSCLPLTTNNIQGSLMPNGNINPDRTNSQAIMQRQRFHILTTIAVTIQIME